MKSGTITMTQLRKEPGEYVRAVDKHGQSFLITKDGKEVARLVPVSDDIVFHGDGTRTGPEPIAVGMRSCDHDGGYG